MWVNLLAKARPDQITFFSLLTSLTCTALLKLMLPAQMASHLMAMITV
jgi:hypothetical protein